MTGPILSRWPDGDVDLEQLADTLEGTADAIDNALRRLPHAAIDIHAIYSLSSLWRISGELAGIANALRLVRLAQQPPEREGGGNG
jgi:hypothetical protein